MNKAIFLDRDGVINNVKGKYYIYQPEDLEINEGIAESLKKFADNGFLLIVISNQSGIAKDVYTHAEAEAIHNLLKKKKKKQGVELTEIYYCPHHSDIENCLCRKPKSLMVEKALARFQIDPAKSWFIGDSQRDVDSGKKVGIKGIKIDPNENISWYCNFIINNDL